MSFMMSFHENLTILQSYTQKMDVYKRRFNFNNNIIYILYYY